MASGPVDDSSVTKETETKEDKDRSYSMACQEVEDEIDDGNGTLSKGITVAFEDGQRLGVATAPTGSVAPAPEATKECDKCGGPHTGFGSTCGKCRPSSKTGGTQRCCDDCGEFFTGFKAVCDECSMKQDKAARLEPSKFPEDAPTMVSVSADNIAKMVCPHCKRVNIFTDGLAEERRLKCSYPQCGEQFQAISCPACGDRNLWKCDNHHSKMKCTREGCAKWFTGVNCPHCYVLNKWTDSKDTEGLKIKCNNDECGQNFQWLNCPHCFGLNVWQNCDYKQGKRNICPYTDCKKTFQTVNCPCCERINVWKGNTTGPYQEGLVTACVYQDCNVHFKASTCPACKVMSVYKAEDLIDGLHNSCAACSAEFQAINCPHCKKIQSWNDPWYRNGVKATCPYKSCQGTFQAVNCPHCKQLNMWKDGSYQDGLVYECVYGTCSKRFSCQNGTVVDM